MGELVALEKPAPGRFCETETAIACLDLIHRARTRGWMAAIVGAPGIGKTLALRRYRDLHSDHAVYCEITTADASLSTMLDVIVGAVGAYSVDRGASNKHRAVVHALCARAAGLAGEAGDSAEPSEADFMKPRARLVLMIDEAQELSAAALQGLKGVYDQAGVAIVLAGNPMAIDRFYLRKGVVRPIFAQIDRRIVLRRRFLAPVPGDVTALAKHYAIAGAKEITFLKKLAAYGHGLALPSNVISEAGLAARGRPIGLRELEGAARSLGIEL